MIFYADRYILFKFPMAGNLRKFHYTMHTIQWKRLLQEYERFTNLLGTLRAIRLSEMVMILFRISLYIHATNLEENREIWLPWKKHLYGSQRVDTE
jgi:hypothetical protein